MEEQALAPLTDDAREDNLAPQQAHSFVCKKCGKGFDSMNAVRMHHLRVHTPGGGGGYAWKVKSKEAQLERKRLYNQKRRDELFAQGLNSKGEPRPPGWKLRKAPTPKGHHPNSHRKWTPERKAKFQATMKAKSKAKRKSIQYVYPLQNQQPTQIQLKGVVQFCPYCGENIERHLR